MERRIKERRALDKEEKYALFYFLKIKSLCIIIGSVSNE